MAPRTVAQIWIDDYLDLLNYAISIGDMEWKKEIILTLSERDQHMKHIARQAEEQKLLAQFESINREMMILNQQLKSSTSVQEELQLKQKVWELKLERLRIAKQLKTG